MTTKRVKIVSPSAELSVLRALMHSDLKISGSVLSMVDDSYFHEDVSKELYHYIKERVAEDATPPSVQLVLSDPSISAEAKEFLQTNRKTNIETVEEAHKFVRVLNKFRKNRILYRVSELINRAFTDEAGLDIDKLTAECAVNISMAQATKSTQNSFVTLGKGDNSKTMLHDIVFGEDTGDIVPTGFSVYDKLTGGFERGSLVTIGATSGSGKSTFALQLAINQARLGYKVVLVPLEMSHKEMLNRLLANVSNTDLSKIRRHQLDDREKEIVAKRHLRFRKEVAKKGGSLMIFRPEEDLDVEEVFAAISGFNCDVCIIDYVSLLKGVDDENQWLRLGSIARKAKINAEVTQRVNILLCQVNDDGKIRYSGALKEHSTASLVWYPTAEDKQAGIIRVEQLKSRNSEPYPFSLRFIWNRMQVESVNDSMESFEPPPAPDQPNLTADI